MRLPTLWFALLATVFALVIGYPVAYFIAIRAGRYRNFLALLVLIPCWITFIIRVYALYQSSFGGRGTRTAPKPFI